MLLVRFVSSSHEGASSRGAHCGVMRPGHFDMTKQVVPAAWPAAMYKVALCRSTSQVFGFSTRQEGQYHAYDWDQLTTVAWNTDPALMCLAHAHGARVVLNANVNNASWLTDSTARERWVSECLPHSSASALTFCVHQGEGAGASANL